MPSPLAHLTMGYAISVLSRRRRPAPATSTHRISKHLAPPYSSLLVALAFSILPDADSVIGILAGDFGAYHNQGSHSLIAGLGAALFFALLLWWKWRSSVVTLSVIALTAYEMHVVMDYFTIGRGVMLFWPLSSERFGAPVKLFYGLHWSEGLISHKHLWTLFTELGFLILMLGLLHLRQGIRPGARWTILRARNTYQE